MMSYTIMSTERDFDLTSFDIDSLDATISNIGTAPYSFGGDSPEFPYGSVPSVESAMLARTFFDSAPSVSVYFFAEKDG